MVLLLLQDELQNLWISHFHKPFPNVHNTQWHSSFFSLTLLCNAGSLGQIWNIWNEWNCFSGINTNCNSFLCSSNAQKIEIKHFSVFLQHPNTVCCIFLSSDHSHSRDKPHSIINDAVRQKGKKLNGVRLRSALENNIKYLSARYKTSSLLEKQILHLEST